MNRRWLDVIEPALFLVACAGLGGLAGLATWAPL